MKPSMPRLFLTAAAVCTVATLPFVVRAEDAKPAPSPAASATPKPDFTPKVTALKSADDLWEYVKKWSNLEDIQPDASQPLEQQMAGARGIIENKVAHLQPALGAFIKQYDKDPRRWEAKLMRVIFLRDPENISDKEVEQTMRDIAAAPDASNDARRQARGTLLEYVVQEADPSKGLTEAFEKELSSYEKDFPDDENGARFVPLRLRFLGDAAGETKINELLARLAQSPNRSTAQAAKDQLALRTEPLDLKFTATNGESVDLAKLRGKVVLLDFWATWCAPCMAKLPEVLAVRKKYEAKDFQIVGVSLDEDKSALTKVTKQKGMDWPEACDEKGFKGEIPNRFGVELIPTAWLVDRQGRLHPLALDADLDEEVGKLIAGK